VLGVFFAQRVAALLCVPFAVFVFFVFFVFAVFFASGVVLGVVGVIGECRGGDEGEGEGDGSPYRCMSVHACS
jgi:hypothetical protein